AFMNSAPRNAATRSDAAWARRWRLTRPLCFRVKAACGRASAMRVKTSSQWPNSVGSVRRNLRRAGVLKYRSATTTVVPGQLAGGDAAAVVFHLHAADAAFLERHGERSCTGVQAVLEQLLQHRGGTLDHFAGRDLADENLGQDANGGHGTSI